MRDGAFWRTISTIAAFVDDLRTALAGAPYVMVMAGLIAVAVRNGVLAWTEALERLFGHHDGHAPKRESP